MTTHSTAEVARIAKGLRKAPRRRAWFQQITAAGSDGLDNTAIPWAHIARLRRDGLSRPVFRSPFYFETTTPLGLAVRAHLEGGL